MALTHIAKAHLPKEFDVEALNAARQNLSHALLLLTVRLHPSSGSLIASSCLFCSPW